MKECNAYCISCGTKAKDDENICTECGNKRLILGEDGIDYIRTPKDILCVNCKENTFKMMMHINFVASHRFIYKCRKCGKNITIDSAKDNEY